MQPVFAQDTARHDEVDVRMKAQVARPCVQHTEEPRLTAEPATEHILQCSSRLAHQRTIHHFRFTQCQRTHFLGHREGDHEVRHWQQPLAVALQPRLGVASAALRAGAMVAGMPRHVSASAIPTTIRLSAKGRSPARHDRTPRFALITTDPF